MKNKKLTKEEIDKLMETKYKKCLPHTKEYIRKKLEEGIGKESIPKSIIVKEDFIEQYYRSREGDEYVPKYNFSGLPEFVQKMSEKVLIICEEIMSNGDVYGDYCTSYTQLIRNKVNPMEVSLYIHARKTLNSRFKKFLERAKSIHGDLYDYSEVEYINNSTKVKIYCNKCKKYFYQTPNDHIDGITGHGCPNCLGRLKTTADFISEAEQVHGKGRYDYSNFVYTGAFNKSEIRCNKCGNVFYQNSRDHVHCGAGCPVCNSNRIDLESFIERSKKIHGDRYDYLLIEKIEKGDIEVPIVDTLTGETFYQKPNYHLKGCGNPSKILSKGEYFVKDWLISRGISFIRNYDIKDKIEGRNSDLVIIDFRFFYNKKEVWIEYNGSQHYLHGPGAPSIFNRFSPKEAEKRFNDQAKRDSNVRNYCKNNHIVLVEILYTYHTRLQILNLLNDVFPDNEHICLNKIIEQKIKYIDKDKEGGT